MFRHLFILLLIAFLLTPSTLEAQDYVNSDSLLRNWSNTKLKDTTRLSSLKLALKGYYLNTNLDSAEILSEQMLQFASKKKNVRYQGVAYNVLGEIEARDGDLEAAIPLFKKGLKYAKKTDDILLISGCLNNIGLVNEWLGNYSESIDYYSQSLKVNMADSVKNAKYIAKTTMNIGNLFFQFEQFDKALGYFKRAERSLKNTPDDNTGEKELTLAGVWASMGDALMKKGRAAEAMPYFQDGKVLFEKWGDQRSLATSYQGIADVHRSLGRYRESLPFYLKALAISEKYEGPDEVAGMLTNTAAAYIDLNDFENAKIYGLKAMDMLDEVQITNPKIAAMWIMVEVYKHEKDFEAATNMLERLGDYKQSLISGQVADEVLKTEIKYNYEKDAYRDSLQTVQEKEETARKHRAEIAKQKREKRLAWWGTGGILLIAVLLGFTAFLIRRRNKELKEKNIIINEALEEKAVLLKEISHRVKNNMQMISGLLHLKARNTKNSKVKDALMDSRSRVDSMGLIHQKMYQKDVYDKIDIADYTNDILRVLVNCAIDPEQYTYWVKGEQVSIGLEKGQAIAFVVHELITNSLKHAWRDEDKNRHITITYTSIENGIELRYEDNGKGLPENIDLSKSDSLGLKLLHSFAVRQLRGSIDSTTSENGGACFIIRMAR